MPDVGVGIESFELLMWGFTERGPPPSHTHTHTDTQDSQKVNCPVSLPVELTESMRLSSMSVYLFYYCHICCVPVPAHGCPIVACMRMCVCVRASVPFRAASPARLWMGSLVLAGQDTRARVCVCLDQATSSPEASSSYPWSNSQPPVMYQKAKLPCHTLPLYISQHTVVTIGSSLPLSPSPST